MQEAIATTPDAPTVLDIPGLRRIVPTDVDGITRLAQNAWRVREVWDDAALANPMYWFMAQYTNPYSLVFDVCDGAGFIAFIKTVPSWRSQIYFAAWDRRAMRRFDLWRTAGAIACAAFDLLVIDGFILPNNRLSFNAAKKAGMTYRGLIKRAGVYDGREVPVHWFEITREALGLPSFTLDEE